MKKIILILFVTMLVLTGCSLTDHNVPISAMQEFDELQAERNQLYRELDDEELWISSYRARNLASCIDKDREFSVALLCKFTTEDGVVDYNTVELGAYRSKFLGDFYRQFYGELLARDIAKNEYVLSQNKKGYEVEVLGGIIAWSHHGNNYSLCDLNGDSQWDYSANEYLSVYNFMSGTEPAYVFEDGYEAYLSHPKELRACEGTERFSDIESRFR